MTDALREHRAPNPVLLGGDVHANWVGHLKADYAHAGSDTVGVVNGCQESLLSGFESAVLIPGCFGLG